MSRSTPGTGRVVAAGTRLAFELRESLAIAARALLANTARGALTTLGIVIGIVAVV